jgi:NADPH:quinone reductase-like Zn-dependent oxidoreductase
MKAVVCRRYGSPDFLEVAEVAKPVAGEGEVVLRVRAAAVNALDGHLLKGRPYVLRLFFGLRRPRIEIPGRDVAGEVESVGPGVTRFAPGDAVFGTCRGAFAEFARAAESSLATKPERASFDQAACLGVAALTALQGLRDVGRIRAGQRVFVHGAAGGVGSFAVQIAKAFGAEATAASRPATLDLVRSLGADRVLDSTREDFTTGGERYDLIFDCYANRPLLACRRALLPGGSYVVAGAPIGSLLVLLASWIAKSVLSALGSRKLRTLMAHMKRADLVALGELLQAGKLSPLIGRRYPLSEAPAAIRELIEGRARGKLVILP